MDSMLKKLFLQQIATQCQMTMVYAQQIDAAMERTPQEFQEDPMPFWAAIQGLLTAVANISKACWGQGGMLADQRKPVRDALEIPDDSPIRETSMRNDFDHFDERLDRWWDTSEKRVHIDLCIGEPMFSGIGDRDIFRWYENHTGTLVFWGDRYELVPIMTEINRLLPIAWREAMRQEDS